MSNLLKINLKQSLLKLEYICVQKNIPFYIIENSKLYGDFSEIIFSNENGQFKEEALIDSYGDIWIDGINAKYCYIGETSHLYEMTKESFNLIPFIEIEAEKDLDSILDKINKWGPNSLLDEEFEFLYNY